MQHILVAKERGAKMIVVDPRFTRTLQRNLASTCISVQVQISLHLWPVMAHFENGWEDKEFFKQRVYGIERIREEAKNTPQKKLNWLQACQRRKCTVLLK